MTAPEPVAEATAVVKIKIIPVIDASALRELADALEKDLTGAAYDALDYGEEDPQ